MADRYALEQVGVADGTLPPKLADGGLVHAKRRVITASFPTGTAQANGDRLYLGKLPIGAKVKAINGITDTTLGTTTLSIGTTASPTKYVNHRCSGGAGAQGCELGAGEAHRRRRSVADAGRRRHRFRHNRRDRHRIYDFGLTIVG